MFGRAVKHLNVALLESQKKAAFLPAELTVVTIGPLLVTLFESKSAFKSATTIFFRILYGLR